LGVRLPSVSSITLLTAVLTSATETAFVTSPGLNLSLDNALVQIYWMVQLNTGAGTTQIQIKLRRGIDITGLQVGANWNNVVTASTNRQLSGCYIDTPGIVAGQQYTVTALQIASAGAGTFSDACIIAMVL
jgi:hypothetical protein